MQATDQSIPSNPNAELKRAVTRGDVELAKRLLEPGNLDVNADPDDLLAVAIKSHDAPMVRLLFDHGARLDPTTTTNSDSQQQDKEPYLWLAVTHQYADIVELLIDAGADVNVVSNGVFYTGYHPDDHSRWQSVLQRSLTNKDEKSIMLLLNNGADVNFVDSAGDTPLSYAAHYSLCSIARELLSRGANANSRNNAGFTVLQVAVLSCCCPLVDLLLDEDADASHPDGTSLLHLAAESHERGSPDVLLTLLRRGDCDVNAQDAWGDTPLHDALRQNIKVNSCFQLVPPEFFRRKIDVLLAYGADATLRNFSEAMSPISAMASSRAQEGKRRPSHLVHRMRRLGAAGSDPCSRHRDFDYCLPVLEHAMRLRARGTPICAEDVEALEGHPVLRHVYAECLAQYEAMERTRVHEGTTYARIFAMGAPTLDRRMRNEEFVGAFRAVEGAERLFPLFARGTSERFERAARRSETLARIEEGLNSALGLRLPYAAIQKIALYLMKIDGRYNADAGSARR